MKTYARAILTTLLTACTTDEADDSDPRDEAFLHDEKADAFGIHERSPEALGTLQLVNTATVAMLDGEVGLSSLAASNIVTHRNDTDVVRDLFGDLQELDAVPYVGESTFTKLLAYAKANRYVSPIPFDPTICSGPPISKTRLQELTENGTKRLPTGATWIRNRQCSTSLGCGAWSEGTKLGVPDSSTIKIGAYADRLNFEPSFVYSESYRSDRYRLSQYGWQFRVDFVDGQATLGAPSAQSHFDYGEGDVRDANLVNETAVLTDSCLRVTAQGGSSATYEVVFLSHF